MANVFICHRSADKPLAEKLAREIRAAGHEVWFDAWEIQVGDAIVGKINAGLGKAGYLVLCYSCAGDSRWTQAEWQSTLTRQLEGEKVKILPALLSGRQIPAILSGVKYADLVTDWAIGVQALLKAIQ